jgi:hypothetical protein
MIRSVNGDYSIPELFLLIFGLLRIETINL